MLCAEKKRFNIFIFVVVSIFTMGTYSQTHADIDYPPPDTSTLWSIVDINPNAWNKEHFGYGDNSSGINQGMGFHYSFSTTTPMYVASTTVLLSKVGNPTDNVQAFLATDAPLWYSCLDAPFIIASSTTIAGDSITTGLFGAEYTFTFNPPVYIGTSTYRLIIKRTGAKNSSNYYDTLGGGTGSFYRYRTDAYQSAPTRCTGNLRYYNQWLEIAGYPVLEEKNDVCYTDEDMATLTAQVASSTDMMLGVTGAILLLLGLIVFGFMFGFGIRFMRSFVE